MELGLSLLSVFVLSALAPLVARPLGKAAGWVLALGPASLAVLLALEASAIARGETLRQSVPWVAGLDVALSFHLDGLSLVFGLLITVIGALILVYAGGYLAGDARLPRFYGTILLFMGSMLGVVLADNIVALFVFWELTSLSSYLLIGFNHESQTSRRAALQALLVTSAGGLALLGGLVLLALAGGSWELSALADEGLRVQEHPLFLPMLLLILLGAFTKSAQFPFHFWLPNAMEAPTPVSAYLHSATMVKAGIYLLARLSPTLSSAPEWSAIVVPVGAATMITGAFLAIQQHDVKRVLAYSTVSALGTLTLLLGVGTLLAVQAAMVFLVAHALCKGALFQVAGVLDHETGTRHLERLGGLGRHMPITATAGILAALSFAGLAPLLSFVGKELLLEALLADLDRHWLVLAVVLLSLMVLVCVAFIVGLRPFIGPLKATPKPPHEAPVSLWLGPLVLAIAGLALGLAPGWAGARLIAPAVTAIEHAPTTTYLSLWHGFTPALLLSMLTLAGGALLYFRWRHVQRATERIRPFTRFGPERGYDHALRGMLRLARWQTASIQTGRLRHYILVTVLAIVGVTAYAFLARGTPLPAPTGIDARAFEIGIGVIMVLAAILITRIDSRLGAVVALGVVGYGQALLYAFFGAPDLAMTQFLFETLTVLLFVLVFYHLPRFPSVSKKLQKGRDLAVSLLAGATMTILVLLVTGAPAVESISRYFRETSYTLGHGRNVVNVILVDYRALDTLGEITVLAAAAFGVFALLKLTSRRKEVPEEPGTHPEEVEA